MTPLRQFIIQAKSAANHVAQPIVRRTAAYDALNFEIPDDLPPQAVHSVKAMLSLMKALPDLDDPMAIREHGAALHMIACGVTRMLPKQPPRRYWREGAMA
jgi:hypothetical protein